ncbi:hypothetical protein C8R43DRAFT_864613, partial [Mycena crocata]
MIALCRSKVWIIQLRDDDEQPQLGDKVPITQRGVRGHIIVYPQKPSAIAKSLPPSIEDITTPICVVFVGSRPPTAEWLRTRASPLIVRKEKVMAALDWLKVHNHLYAEVIIDRTVLQDLPPETMLPFHIQHILPNSGIDITTSDYVPGSSLPESNSDSPAAGSYQSVPFQSVVVTDVDGNAPSDDLRAAALAHMQKPGANYVEIPHGETPMNEFKNPNLLPMMYPTLFPYGLGGTEQPDRRSPLSFKRQIKH